MSSYQTICIQNLARCRFAPATWDKKFARDLAAKPEGVILTPKQRANLYRLVVRYRKQLATNDYWRTKVIPYAQAWVAVPADQRAFEDALDADSFDWTTRAVYGDWLEEHGQPELAAAQRWMVEHKEAPEQRPCGTSYGAGKPVGCNHEYHFYRYGHDLDDDPVYRAFGPFGTCWFPARELAEQRIAEALMGMHQERYAKPPNEPDYAIYAMD